MALLDTIPTTHFAVQAERLRELSQSGIATRLDVSEQIETAKKFISNLEAQCEEGSHKKNEFTAKTEKMRLEAASTESEIKKLKNILDAQNAEIAKLEERERECNTEMEKAAKILSQARELMREVETARVDLEAKILKREEEAAWVTKIASVPVQNWQVNVSFFVSAICDFGNPQMEDLKRMCNHLRVPQVFGALEVFVRNILLLLSLLL